MPRLTHIIHEAKVLIVDDDAAFLNGLSELLRFRFPNVVVETATSAAVALERLQRADYDAVLTDIKMPKMDGVALMQAIKARYPDTPVLLMTGQERKVDVRALKSAAYAYIEKPIDREYLTTALEHAIELRQLGRQVERQQRQLLDEQERFRKLASIAPVGIFRMDPEGRHLYVNERWCQIAGLTAGEALGEGLLQAISREDRNRVMDTLQEAIRTHGRFQAEYRLQQPGGQTAQVYGEAVAEVSTAGKLLGYIGTITEHPTCEDRLWQAELRFHRLFQTVQDVVYTLAPDGTITSLNPAFERHTGWSRDEWVGQPFAPLIHEEDLPLAMETFEASLAGQMPERFLLRVHAKHGGFRLGEFCEGPDQDGPKVVGVQGIGRDVTDPIRDPKAPRHLA
jgi:PAS domain S-box-containing protein